jgi:hypothetical protein
MKLSQGINILRGKKPNKNISKKILLANTSDKLLDLKVQGKATAVSNDPIYSTSEFGMDIPFNPDIRFRNIYQFNPLTNINYRNDLLLLAENDEIKDVVDIVANEVAIMDSDINKYPVFPYIDLTKVEGDKIEVAKAIDEYINTIFFPVIWQTYNFADDGLINVIKEFLITGKLCYEIIYDNLKTPNDIIGLQPIDPATIQKYKIEGFIFYVQKPMYGDAHERILHENQVILIEWNEYDFGYVSYVDNLRRSFNIMRSMMSSKILWFAAKSQIRMHIKLAFGDITRTEAINRLTTAKNQYTNQFYFNEDLGTVLFNGQPNNNAYREFFTAETNGSGHPEIEEVNANGTDLSEVDSLQYWEKLFYRKSKVPYDRIDPASTDTWGFADVSNLRKIEINFAKFINKIRKFLNPLFLKPIIIQLTLKEVEIGVDLSLLSNIVMKWIAFNQYESMAELELMSKRMELANNMAAFGEAEDVNGAMRKLLPIQWIIRSQLGLTEEQLKSIEVMRKYENVMLGFNPDGTQPNEESKEGESTESEESTEKSNEEDDTTDGDIETASSIRAEDNKEF